MSFIAGYILGCGDVGDRRVKMLDELDHIYKLDIGEGWDIRIKIADNIDNAQYFNFAQNHGGIGDYITMWTL